MHWPGDQEHQNATVVSQCSYIATTKDAIVQKLSSSSRPRGTDKIISRFARCADSQEVVVLDGYVPIKHVYRESQIPRTNRFCRFARNASMSKGLLHVVSVRTKHPKTICCHALSVIRRCAGSVMMNGAGCAKDCKIRKSLLSLVHFAGVV